MGVTESKPKILNQRVNYRYDALNLDGIDRIYTEIFPVVKEVEIVRCEFLLRWNEFVRLSGGIVLLMPRFESCVQGMLWKLATGLNGRLSTVQIFEGEPFIQVNEAIRAEDLQLMQSFQEVCRYYQANDSRVRRLESELQKYKREAVDLQKDPEAMLTDKYNVRPIDIYPFTRKLSANAKKVTFAYEEARFIRETFDDIHRGLNRYSGWIKLKDQQRRFEAIGVEAISKKYTKAPRIVYKFSKDDKVSSYDDHLDFIQDDLKAEKDARYILGDLGLPSTSTTKQIFVKKEERLPTAGTTASAMRKETEASANEHFEREVPIMKTTVITKEPIVERSISAVSSRGSQDIQEIPSEREEVRKYNVRDLNNKENVDINIVTRPPVKKLMTMPEIKREVHYVTDYNDRIARSETYEQPDLRQSTVTIDVESLQREVEQLRRENRNLNDKLSQSQMVVTTTRNNIPLRSESDSSGREKLPTQVNQVNQVNQVSQVSQVKQRQLATSVNVPAFVKHDVPLKSWNFALRKTLKMSQEASECIEPAIDLEMIITGHANGKLIFWKFVNFTHVKEQEVIQLDHSRITSLLYLSDGKTLLCGCQDGGFYKVDLETFSATLLKDFEAPVTAIVNPLKGSSFYLAVGKKIVDFDLSSNEIRNAVEAHDMNITAIAFNGKKEILCTGAADQNIKIWSLISMECVGVLQGHLGAINSLCFAYAGSHLILCSVAEDSSLILWNLTDKNLTKSLTVDSPAHKVFYLHDKKTVVTVHKAGTFHLWNTDKANEKDFFSNKTPYLAGCYYGDGHNLIFTTEDNKIEFWNAK